MRDLLGSSSLSILSTPSIWLRISAKAFAAVSDVDFRVYLGESKQSEAVISELKISNRQSRPQMT
jgi:hypothetical protein